MKKADFSWKKLEGSIKPSQLQMLNGLHNKFISLGKKVMLSAGNNEFLSSIIRALLYQVLNPTKLFNIFNAKRRLASKQKQTNKFQTI